MQCYRIMVDEATAPILKRIEKPRLLYFPSFCFHIKEKMDMPEKDYITAADAHSQNHEHLFKEIYKRSLPKIRKYILANSGTDHDVEDIFQDSILIFYNQLTSGKFQEGADFEPYLYRIACNLYINMVKKHNRWHKVPHTELPDESRDSLGQLIEREQRYSFHKLFMELDDRCRELLTLRIVQRLSIKEIVAKMGLSNENVAKTMVYRSKVRLLNLAKSQGMVIDTVL